MAHVAVLRAAFPCPSCGEVCRLPALVAEDAGALPGSSLAGTSPLAEGRLAGTVPECPSCWRRRVDVVQAARAKLRASGLLADAAPRASTWMGSRLGGRADGLEDAIASELLRAGLRTVEVRQRVVIELHAGRATFRPLLEPEPATASAPAR